MPSLTQSNYNVIFLPPLLVSQIENPNHFPRTLLFVLSPQIITSTSVPTLFHAIAQVLDLILYRNTLETINFVSNEHFEHCNSKKTTRTMCIYKAKKKNFSKQNQHSPVHSAPVHLLQPILFTHTITKTFPANQLAKNTQTTLQFKVASTLDNHATMSRVLLHRHLLKITCKTKKNTKNTMLARGLMIAHQTTIPSSFLHLHP